MTLTKGVDAQLRYPYDLHSRGSDYFLIEVLEYKAHSGGFEGGFKDSKSKNFDSSTLFKDGNYANAMATASDKYGSQKAVHSIILPIPQDIQDNNGVNWGEDKLNDFAGMAAEFGKEIIEGNIGDIPDKIAKAGDGAKNRGTQAINYMKTIATAQFANVLNANVTASGLLSRTTGQVVNQNVEVLFNGVQLRSFNFNWNLAPRTSTEAKEVRKIIRLLKARSAAKMKPGNLGFLNAPDIFRLTYMKGQKEHPFLNRFKVCALRNMQVNYTSSGTYATYDDGAPVHMNLGLQFMEMNPIYAEDYDAIPLEKGVGF